ncbi:helix-turn-helix domain-containing protein [Trinickia fusca]|uniref:Response regulator n=1 Tax=Trinickia fusca TaxID=2419777 RepID=A0A494X6H8_9BURK|nr:helix-turn-helix domain-containing protein [Trinickia fusca]RKP43856.1 response regulator [Trinickia fusca]
MTNEATSMDSLAVAERVRSLMSRHGIGKRQQTTELCRILDLSFSQGHRKLRGSSPWTLAQIRKVAEAFGEPPMQLIGAELDDAGVAGAQAHEAQLCVGAFEWPCIAWIGAPLDARSSAEFAAYAHGDHWRIVRCDGMPEANAREVVKIEIHPKRCEPRRMAVAVVDSDGTAADALRTYLEQHGFATTVLDSLPAFVDALRTQTFDAIVTDWSFGEETAAAAIEAVRRSGKADAPVFLLTGDLLTGKASEAEISEVIRRFDVACYEKPARLAILVADLSKRLGRG